MTTYIAFAGARTVAEGPLTDVLPLLHRRFEKDPSDLVLVFEDETGRQVDFDLSRSPEELLAELAPARPPGPGRPKLGVVSREVSLLPRHWDWLEEQPQGLSGTLRRLVEQAIKTEPGKQRAARIRAALSRVLSAVAGDRPHFEEATRALFAGETERFDELIERWPKDIRTYASRRADEASRLERRPA